MRIYRKWRIFKFVTKCFSHAALLSFQMGPQLGTLKAHLQFPLVHDKDTHRVLQSEPEQHVNYLLTSKQPYHFNQHQPFCLLGLFLVRNHLDQEL